MNTIATAFCAFLIMRNRVLDRRRDLLEAAFVESPDFQYVKTLASRFVAVNKQVLAINGFSSTEQMIGKTDIDLAGPERGAALMAAEQQVVATNQPLLNFEERVTDPDGNEIWYSTSKVPLHDPDGDIIGIGGVTRDVTSRRRLRIEATESRNRLDYVLSEVSDGIAMFDAQGTPTYCNEQYRNLFPLTRAARRSGQHIRDILHAVAEAGEQRGIPAGQHDAWIDEVAATLHVEGNQEIQLFNGRWLHARTRPTKDGAALVVISDISAIKDAETEVLAMNEQLKLLATTDGLTGLVNRRSLDQILDSEVARHHRSHQSLAVLMIDVDRFKAYNDVYGHPAGDTVLVAVAAALRQALKRPTDVAARYGGEEFIGILPGTDEDGAFFIADAFRRSLHALSLAHSGSERGFVTASIGIAVLTNRDPSLTALELVRRADEALYTAKEAGRDRVTGWRRRHDVRLVSGNRA